MQRIIHNHERLLFSYCLVFPHIWTTIFSKVLLGLIKVYISSAVDTSDLGQTQYCRESVLV